MLIYFAVPHGVDKCFIKGPSPARASAKDKERSLWKSNFDVSATCVEGYTGKAHVEACSESGKPYVLNGCKKAWA